MVRVPIEEHIFTSSVLFSGKWHLLEQTFSRFNFSRFLAVANFANIDSNESFCPVGYVITLMYHGIDDCTVSPMTIIGRA